MHHSPEKGVFTKTIGIVGRIRQKQALRKSNGGGGRGNLAWWIACVVFASVALTVWAVQWTLRPGTRVKPNRQIESVGKIPGWQSASKWYKVACLIDQWGLPCEYGDVCKAQRV